jgi:hypothetical protein
MGGRRSSPAPPTLQAPRVVPLEETFSKFLGQTSQFPALSSFAGDVNKMFRSELETGLPGTLGASTQLSSLVNQLLGGEIPADVQAQVRRGSAEQAQAVGLPGASEMSRNLQARDFGMTSMGLMQQGAAYAPGLMELSNFLSPQQAQNYLFSTGQLRGEDLKQAQDVASTNNQNAVNKYNYDVAKAQSGGNGGLFGSIGGLIGGAVGSFAMPGVGTAIGGMLGSGLGSLAGGGGFSMGAGQSGGLMSSMAGAGSSLFGGGLLGGGGGSTGLSGLGGGGTTAFSSIGQAFTMPQSSFGAPQYSSNMIYNYLRPSSPGGYGGGGIGSVTGF